jgi:hypothetical protein
MRCQSECSFADQHRPIDGDGLLFQQREMRPAMHAGSDELTGDFAKPPLEEPSVSLGAASDPSNSGRTFPLGATVLAEGVNFSVFTRRASRVELLLFDCADAAHPTCVIELDARTHRTYHYWHVFVPGIGPGQVYAYRAIGPFDPEHGLRIDPSKILLDPYGRAVAVPDGYSRHMSSQFGENDTIAMKSVVVDPDVYDWEGDAPLRRPFATTVIYEMHVAGFTRHPSSAVAAELRGTYAGMIEKIPYLQDLGITAVELLPVFQFDRQDCPAGLVNYWGYSPVSFFAPHAGYSSRQDALGPVNAYWEALDFDLPSAPTSAVAGWQRWIDTSRASPDDITDIGATPLALASQYRVAPRSVAALFAQPGPIMGQLSKSQTAS